MKQTPHRMLDSYPGEVGLDRALLAECIAACVESAQASTACADACLGEKAVADLVACIRLDLDCADLCEATGRVLSRQTAYDPDLTGAALRACVQACSSCATECEQHAQMHEHCRICAEACRHCEDVCSRVLAAIG